jgi:hypothetical protein
MHVRSTSAGRPRDSGGGKKALKIVRCEGDLPYLGGRLNFCRYPIPTSTSRDHQELEAFSTRCCFQNHTYFACACAVPHSPRFHRDGKLKSGFKTNDGLRNRIPVRFPQAVFHNKK